MKILILATHTPSKYLIEAIEARGHTYKHYKPSDVYLFTSDNTGGHDKVFNGSADLPQPRQILLKNFDAIITRLGGDLQYSCNVLKHLNENLNLYSPQTASALLNASDKLRTIQLCSNEGLRVPKTMYAKNPTHVNFLVHKIGGLPAVAKTVKGSQGNGVFILKDVEQTNTSLQAIYNLNVDLILQEYVESEKTDIRAIVVGDKVICAMERKGTKDFRANLSQKGGSGKKIELSDDDRQICIDAAKAVGLEFAGVDIIKHYMTGKTYVIEVNGNPGTKSIEITDTNWFVDLVAHVENKTIGAAIEEALSSQTGHTDITNAVEQPVVINDGSSMSVMRRYFGLN